MKTWEMLRDIREGDMYEVAKGPFEGSAVAFATYSTYASKVLMWNADRYFDEAETFVATTAILDNYDWRKRQQLVDFPTAFAAYERGARITSQVTGDWVQKDSGILSDAFSTNEIRGKWTIEEAQYDAN
jgi:hypothetical protein